MAYIDIHNGTVHKLNSPSLLALLQTFEMIFKQYSKRPNTKASHLTELLAVPKLPVC